MFWPFEGRERPKHFLATWRDKDNRETEKSKKTKGKRTKISILIFVYLKVFIVFENHFALMKSVWLKGKLVSSLNYPKT